MVFLAVVIRFHVVLIVVLIHVLREVWNLSVIEEGHRLWDVVSRVVVVVLVAQVVVLVGKLESPVLVVGGQLVLGESQNGGCQACETGLFVKVLEMVR